MNQLMTTGNNVPASPGAPSMHAGMPPEPPEHPHSPIRRLSEAAFRSKGVLLVLAVLGGVIGAGVGIMKPNEYSSTAKFIFRSGSENVAVRPGDGLPRGWGGPGSLLENAPQLLMSAELARRTVRRVGVAQIFRPFRPQNQKSGWFRSVVQDLQGSIHSTDPENKTVDQAADKLLGNLNIVQPRHTTAMTVTYSANQPRLAQDVLKAYCKEAIKYHIEVYGDKVEIQLVQADFESAKTKFEKASVAKKKFDAETGMHDFDLQFGMLRESSAVAQRDLEQLQEVTVRSLEAGIAQNQKDLKELEPKITREWEEIVPNTTLGVLRSEEIEAKGDLANARADYGEKSTEYRNAARKLKLLQERISIEERTPPKAVARKEIIDNPAYVQRQNKIKKDQLDLQIAKASLPGKIKAAEELKKRVSGLIARSTEYREITARLEKARDLLHSREIKFEQARQKTRLQENELSTLRLVEEPSFQPHRTGPKRAQILLLGILAGLGIGLGLIGMRALTDKTVRTPEELEQLIGLRVLATVPDLRAKHIRRHENRILSGC